ncbi:hypothetical protein M408DRAFT_26872 [Serendipita vermifera MAFF 305830]|uniref:Uncharacterized protein n=1 Tax=Serendipita vermifera MAFF 305830 TaxID=933852 RepID=A0A0C3AZB1_SERVB|nr:hypothetical protein M408DRAFT_26872 [Serendipita vermifera MAFF 305830]
MENPQVIPRDQNNVEIQRRECTQCNCVAHISDGGYACLCGHPWHSHEPADSEQGWMIVRYRRGASVDSQCTSYYPVRQAVDMQTPCYCGMLLTAHQLRSVLVTGSQYNNAQPQQLLPTPSRAPVATSREAPRLVDMLARGPNNPALSASQQRSVLAHNDFHGRVPLSARSYAPGPTPTGSAATTSLAGPRLGFPSAPTTQVVRSLRLGPNVATVSDDPEYILAILPVKYVKTQSSTVLAYVAQRLTNKLDDLFRRLDSYSLLVSYTPSSNPDDRKGQGFIRHIHNAITDHTRSKGYSLPGAHRVPNVPEEISYDDLPWRFVWYASKRTQTSIVSNETKIAIPGFNVDALKTTPFGRGDTRPQVKKDKRAVIMIMMRYTDLMGLRPATQNRSNFVYNNDTTLHRCIGRRIMNGLYSEANNENPAYSRCLANCTLQCDPDTLIPGEASVQEDSEVIQDAIGDVDDNMDLEYDNGEVTAPSPTVPTPPLPTIQTPPGPPSPPARIAPIFFRNRAPNPLPDSIPPTSSSTGESRVRRRSDSMEFDTLQPSNTRRRVDLTSEDGVANTIPLSEASLFPAARSPAIPAVTTIQNGENVVEAFISNISLHLQSAPHVTLRAQDEKIAARAIYNLILQEANSRYESDARTVAIDADTFTWDYNNQPDYISLFTKDFSLVLEGDPNGLTVNTAFTIGNGPKNATLRELVDLLLKDSSIFNQLPNALGYRDLNFGSSEIVDPIRQARLWAAGCISALHIIRTGAGPHPISPFLLYCALEDSLDLLVNEDFVGRFDPTAAAAFFPLLARVEARKAQDQKPFLLPLNTHYMVFQSGQIENIESETFHRQPQLVRRLVIGMLGEMLGLRQLTADHPHPDFKAFRSGFQECFNKDPILSKSLFPQATREFIFLLCSRHPKDPKVVSDHIRFRSCHKAEYKRIERRWETGIRNYVLGKGIPSLVKWAGAGGNNRFDFNQPTGRASQVLWTMTGSDLMPVSDPWFLTFQFCPSNSDDLNASTLASDAKALSIDFHSCMQYGNIALPNPIMNEVTKCPELFEARRREPVPPSPPVASSNSVNQPAQRRNPRRNAAVGQTQDLNLLPTLPTLPEAPPVAPTVTSATETTESIEAPGTVAELPADPSSPQNNPIDPEATSVQETLASTPPSSPSSLASQSNLPDETSQSNPPNATTYTVKTAFQKQDNATDGNSSAYHDLMNQFVQIARTGGLPNVERIEIQYREDDDIGVPPNLSTSTSSALSQTATLAPGSAGPSSIHAITPLVSQNLPTPPALVAPVDREQTLSDLQKHGAGHAIELQELVQAHQVESAKFFFTRRCYAIIEDLGSIFNLPPGNHTKPYRYTFAGQAAGEIVTADLMKWAQDHGNLVNLRTASNHRTVWNRASSLHRYLERHRNRLATAGNDHTVDLQELDRVIELLNILVKGIDIDAQPPTHNEAEDIWRMRKEEWTGLIALWEKKTFD